MSSIEKNSYTISSIAETTCPFTQESFEEKNSKQQMRGLPIAVAIVTKLLTKELKNEDSEYVNIDYHRDVIDPFYLNAHIKLKSEGVRPKVDNGLFPEEVLESYDKTRIETIEYLWNYKKGKIGDNLYEFSSVAFDYGDLDAETLKIELSKLQTSSLSIEACMHDKPLIRFQAQEKLARRAFDQNDVQDLKFWLQKMYESTIDHLSCELERRHLVYKDLDLSNTLQFLKEVQNNPHAQAIGCLALMGKGNEGEHCLQELKNLTENSETKLLAEILLGDHYKYVQEIELALEHFKGAIQVDSNNIYAIYSIGLIYKELAACTKNEDDYREAEKYYNLAYQAMLETENYSPSVYLELANLYFFGFDQVDSDIDKARKIFREFCLKQKEQGWPKILSHSAYFPLYSLLDCEELFTIAQELLIDDTGPMYHEADQLYKLILDKDKKNYKVYLARILANDILRRDKTTEELLEKAFILWPKSVELYTVALSLSVYKTEWAEKLLNIYIEIYEERSDPDPLIAIISLCSALGKMEALNKFLGIAYELALNSENTGFILIIAQCYFRPENIPFLLVKPEGDLKKAKRLYERAFEVDRSNPSIIREFLDLLMIEDDDTEKDRITNLRTVLMDLYKLSFARASGLYTEDTI